MLTRWHGADSLAQAPLDLAAVENGSKAVGWSNTHYGHPRNMLNPGVGINMGDGWETARRMDRPAVLTLDSKGHLEVPGHEWCVIELGVPGTPSQVVVATTHFKGNFPESCMVEGCIVDEGSRHFGSRMHVTHP
jgi:allantoicase